MPPESRAVRCSDPSRLHPEMRWFTPEPDLLLMGCSPIVPYHGFAPDMRAEWDRNGELVVSERFNPPFHAPENVRVDQPEDGPTGYDKPWPADGRCRVCKGRIGRAEDGTDDEPEEHPGYKMVDRDRQKTLVHVTACSHCHAMSPSNDARASALAKHARIAKDAQATACRDLIASASAAVDLNGLRLTEADRRQIWFGGRVPKVWECGQVSQAEPKSFSRPQLRRMEKTKGRKASIFLSKELTPRQAEGRKFLESIRQLPSPHLILDLRGREVARFDRSVEIELTDANLLRATTEFVNVPKEILDALPDEVTNQSDRLDDVTEADRLEYASETTEVAENE